MNSIFRYLALILLWSCGHEKTVQLPEIDHTDITQLQDVSSAYLFYDETQKDSIWLNRKNLISTTHWLVNVDKRLTLKQVIPHLKFLQEKKQNAGHKNENAKNYFTCHDLSKHHLGFVEFTDVVYKLNDIPETLFLKENKNTINIHFISSNKIQITCYWDMLLFKSTNMLAFENEIKSLITTKNGSIKIILSFNNKTLFQDYITMKSKVFEFNTENITLSKTEFIY